MKPHISLLLLFFIIFTVPFYAQVGIGTTNPDPSAALDISSTDGGMLTPRMTTAQRTAIASPATGLLVFDTDLDLFYYFDGAIWQPLGSAEIRDNYKLVKDISDLSDEFSGGSYVLNTDYLYEINGSITVDAPIDLNGAYIEGVDVSEDILINASGGTLFTGSVGGSLRNITIDGNGSSIFDLTGGTLVLNNSVMVGSSSLGNLDGLDLAFFSITQYVNNGDGFTVTDVDSYFMSNSFWTETNTGTFLDLNGTFSNIQMANGRIVVNSGETGLDVSANPSINNEASLSGISFVGNGDFVNGYTTGTYPGYNFTVEWYVNCSGLLNETHELANADFYYDGVITTGFTQTISNGTAVEIQAPAIDYGSDKLFRFRIEGNGNRMVYEGTIERSFQIVASLSVRVTNASGDFYGFTIAKNGVPLERSNAVVRIDNDSQIQSISLNAVIDLTTDDYIEIYVQRLTGSFTDTLVVFSESVSIK
ncbi:cell wall anchor protein [Altibacter sp. HG106]|uniref:cell wall anchor protein n=1 Tax=Altibacter sp. HG106 TaxID=3023937 RepID=UPI002350408D|nr:cell wall anchor protein [Altibacter sp. HG106]MDC7994083.1 cell wall anchor protein [Altibacter sp. HG106]